MRTFLRPVMAVCLLLFTVLFVAPPAFSEGLEVIVSGVGKTENSARQQAYRNAIQQVVGTLIVSDVLVQNNDVINDKILSHSDGYITKAEQLGPVRAIDGGLIEVTMKVTVKSDQLKKTLQTANITSVPVDGVSLAAESQTKKEGTQDAPAIIAEIFKPLPASVVTAKADMSKAAVKDNILTVPVKVSVDMATYGMFVAKLKDTLGKMGSKIISRSIQNGKGFPYEDEYDVLHSVNKFTPDRYTLLLVERVALASNGVTAKISMIALQKEVYDSIIIKKGIRVTVELLDAAGVVVTENTLVIDEKPVIYNHGSAFDETGLVNVYPRLWVTSFWPRSSSLSVSEYYSQDDEKNSLFNVEMVLNSGELERVKSARCTVSTME